MEEHSNTQRAPYLFTAKELDEETGLYYFGARYYDPRTSVWQSPDPILAKYLPTPGESASRLAGMGGVFNPININLFQYAGANPVKYRDPNGKWFGFDDVFTGPVDEAIVVGLLATGAVLGVPGAQDALDNLSGAISNAFAPRDPTMTDMALAYPFRNPSNIIAMAQGQITEGLQVSANRAAQLMTAPNEPGQVRIQLQTGGVNISSISMASPNGSVSKVQAQGGLAYVYINGIAKDSSLAGNPGFTQAIIQASAQIGSVPRGGLEKGGNAFRKTFTHNNQVYRLDVEILRGTAFME